MNKQSSSSTQQAQRKDRTTGLPLVLSVLLAYCLLACLGLGLAGFNQYQTLAALQAQAARQDAELSRLTTERVAAETIYREDAAQQEQQRMQFSGAQAIAMGDRVLRAKERYEVLKGQEEALKTANVLLDETAAKLARRWVPLIALFLLHFIGLFLLRQRLIVRPV